MAPSRHITTNQNETRAIVSLFLGIAAFAFGPLAGLPAIALGSAARKSIAHSGVRSRGSLVATMGTLVGFFGMGFFAVFALYLGNALLGANAEAANLSPTTVEESQAKLTAPALPTRPAVHRDIEMMHSPR